MNIFDEVMLQHCPKQLVDAVRIPEMEKLDLTTRVAKSWFRLIMIGVSGQCALLAASWLAAETGNWCNRETWKKNFDFAKCKEMVGSNEQWAIELVHAWRS